jgi:DNA adenine methylase
VNQALITFPSPLRYPGGKRKVGNFVKLFILENDLLGAEYVEPYAGGASVALSLLYEDYIDHIHINDIDTSIYTFWHVVLNKTDELCSRIASVKVTVEEWHRQCAVQLSMDPDDVDLAFSTFFLNRTNRSGIIRGGLIGGKNQTGAWKLDARFMRDNLIRRIQKAGRFRSRITLSQLDASVLLKTWTVTCEVPTVLYLDPPYYVKGEGLYKSFYSHSHHVEIEGIVERLKVPWMVSYDAAPEIEELYGKYSSLHYSLSYSAADRYRGSEVMFFPPTVHIPVVDNPAAVPSKHLR